MPYALGSGVSFCRVAGRLLFLDVERDRYVCLSARAERAFERLADGQAPSEADRSILHRLSDDGLLRPGDPDRPTPCALAAPTRSLLDEDLPVAGPCTVAAAGAALAAATAHLRLRGLATLLRGTARRKARVLRPDPGSDEPVRRTAAAFDRLSGITTAHDRCLVRSVAVARRLAALGVRCDLVVGVKLQPFKAHCWVQRDGALVNDRLEVVRPFTPILTV